MQAAPRRDRFRPRRAYADHLLLNAREPAFQIPQVLDHQSFGAIRVPCLNGGEKLAVVVHRLAGHAAVGWVLTIEPVEKLEERLHDQGEDPVARGSGEDGVKLEVRGEDVCAGFKHRLRPRNVLLELPDDRAVAALHRQARNHRLKQHSGLVDFVHV